MKYFLRKHTLAHTRALRAGSYSIAASVLFILIAITVNVFVGMLPIHYTRKDISTNKLFSISEETKNVLTGLSEDISVYWFVQNGAESETLSLLLDNYADMSSHIKLVKKDPDVSPSLAQKFFPDGIKNNSIVVFADDSRYISIDYSDIFVYSNSVYDSTYTSEASFNGESELTSAIIRISGGNPSKLYITTGHGEAKLTDGLTKSLEKHFYELYYISLITAEDIPEDADCILICAPVADISSDEAQQLKDYISSGGTLMLITDPSESGQNLELLEAVISEYGVSAENGIVIEGDENYYYGLGYPYYLLPAINEHEITTPIIEGHYHVLLPIAHGLNVSTTLPDNVYATSILSTSESSYIKKSGYAAESFDKEDSDTDGPFSLAAAIEDCSVGSRIVWVSSYSLVDETISSYVSGANTDFFLNSLSWLCGQDNQIAIHARVVSAPYLIMSDSSASILSVVLVLLIPSFFLSVGIIICIRRKRR